MATTSVYDIVIPAFIAGLQTYDQLLGKAEEYSKEKGLDVDATFVNARLAEDQLPLSFQVQNTTRLTQINLSRLTGEEITPFDADEETFSDLRERVRKTLGFLKEKTASDAAKTAAVGREDVLIDLPALGKTYQVPVKVAVLNHGLPNYFFHLNAGYQIIRSKGVPVGKADYLTSFLGF